MVFLVFLVYFFALASPPNDFTLMQKEGALQSNNLSKRQEYKKPHAFNSSLLFWKQSSVICLLLSSGETELRIILWIYNIDTVF